MTAPDQYAPRDQPITTNLNTYEPDVRDSSMALDW